MAAEENEENVSKCGPLSTLILSSFVSFAESPPDGADQGSLHMVVASHVDIVCVFPLIVLVFNCCTYIH